MPKQNPSAQVTYLLWPALRDNQTEQPSKLSVTRTFPAVLQGTLPTFSCARDLFLLKNAAMGQTQNAVIEALVQTNLDKA